MPKKQFSFKNVITEKNSAGYYQFSATNLADGFANFFDYEKLTNEGDFNIDKKKSKELVNALTDYSKSKSCQNVGAFNQEKIEKTINFCKKNNIAFDDFVKTPEKYLNGFMQNVNARYDINTLTEGKSLGEKLYLMQVGPQAKKVASDIKTCKDVADIRLTLAELGSDEKQIEENKAFAKLKNDLTVNNTIKYIQQPRITSELETTVHNMLAFKDKTVEEYCSSPEGKFDIFSGKMANALNLQESLADTTHRRKINYRTVTERANDIYKGYLQMALRRNQTDKAQEIVDAIKSFAKKSLPFTDYQDKKIFQNFADKLTVKLSAKQVFNILDGEDAPAFTCSSMSKNIVLSMHGEQVRQYGNLSWWTRFVSHFPGVNNEATKLREEMYKTEKELIVRGAEPKEILDAEKPDFKRNIYHLPVNFEYDVNKVDLVADFDFTKQLENSLKETTVDVNLNKSEGLEPKTEVVKEY